MNRSRLGLALLFHFVCLGVSQTSFAQCEQDFQVFYQYQSCRLKTDRPIFNSGQGPVCGVRYSNFGFHESCGSETRTCRRREHGVESWNVIMRDGGTSTDWHDGDDKDSCSRKATEAEQYWKQRRSGPNGESLDGDKIIDVTKVSWESQEQRILIGNILHSRRYRCQFQYNVVEVVYIKRVSDACGSIGYQRCQYAPPEYEVCRHSQFGIQEYEYEDGFGATCGVNYDPQTNAISIGDKSNNYKNWSLAPNNTDSKKPFNSTNFHNKSCGLCDDVKDPGEKFVCLTRNAFFVQNQKNQKLTDLENQADLLLTNKATKELETYFDLNKEKLSEVIIRLWNQGKLEDLNGTAFLSDALNSMNHKTYIVAAFNLAKQMLFDVDRVSERLPTSFKTGFFMNHQFAPNSITYEQLLDLKNIIQTNRADIKIEGRSINWLFIGNLYVNMVNEFLGSKLRELRSLKLIRSKIGINKKNLKADVKIIESKIINSPIDEESKNSLMQKLEMIGRSSSFTKDILISIMDNLITGAETEYKIVLESSERFIEQLTTKSKVLDINRALFYLHRGQYGASMSLLIDALNNRPLIWSDSLVQAIKLGFVRRVKTQLESDYELINLLNSYSGGNIDLSEFLVSTELSPDLVILIEEINSSLAKRNSEQNVGQIIELVRNKMIQPLLRFQEVLK